MLEILVINDNSGEAFHAAEYAFNLAINYNKNIVLLNITTATERLGTSKLVNTGEHWCGEMAYTEPEAAEELKGHLRSLCRCDGFMPEIKTIAAGAYTEANVIAYVNSRSVWMVVMPAVIDENVHNNALRLNMQTVINRIISPVLIIPDNYQRFEIERIVYLADLRYTQIPILNYLLKFNGHGENIILAHRCAPGLPEIAKPYADELFQDGICNNIKTDKLFFTRIGGRKMETIVDTLIHGIQADMLVCVNRHFHFDELIGKSITSKLPDYLSVPVLVFPN